MKGYLLGAGSPGLLSDPPAGAAGSACDAFAFETLSQQDLSALDVEQPLAAALLWSFFFFFSPVLADAPALLWVEVMEAELFSLVQGCGHAFVTPWQFISLEEVDGVVAVDEAPAPVDVC